MVILAVISGCVSAGKSPQAKFYSLRPLKDAQKPKIATPALKDVIIGVGPLELPAYLDRPQIVTRGGDNELVLAEFHRWAEPLDEAILRVVAQNLMSIFPDSNVLLYPWGYYVPVKYQVVMEIISIDAALQNEVRLSVNWSALNTENKKVFLTRNSVYTAKIDKANYSKSNYNGLIQALNHGFYEFSQEIARAIAAEVVSVPEAEHKEKAAD
jgi:uncharacterized lipoprotein YmbA